MAVLLQNIALVALRISLGEILESGKGVGLLETLVLWHVRSKAVTDRHSPKRLFYVDLG